MSRGGSLFNLQGAPCERFLGLSEIEPVFRPPRRWEVGSQGALELAGYIWR